MLSALCVSLALTAGQGAAAVDEIQWDRDVRPILSRSCFACHGFDGEARKAKLRLDVDSVREDERGIIVPGDPAASLLLKKVRSSDPQERMPPPEEGDALSREEIAILERWIAEGAVYRGHWSFEPVADPIPPQLPERFGEVKPIDAFVIARLLDAGLEPSPEADRRTLIRRVTFDLTGEPPTPEEIDAYLADTVPGAYERVVDRLLESPAYAERMTLAWMDAARYGDTSVYHADGPRTMWPWRDWVLSAYDRNMPFDRFTLLQLAGDLVPGAGLEGEIASGFHRNNGTSDEGGAIDEELRVSYMVDRVKTTGNVWLGLSIECGQCHDHKYDPIPQEDYYRFFAYFNQADEKGFQTRTGNAPPLVRVPDGDEKRELARLGAERERLMGEYEAEDPPLEAFAAWHLSQRLEILGADSPRLGPWSSLGPLSADNSREAFERDFGPETLVRPLEYGGGGEALAWKPRPQWRDGQVQSLGSASNSAFYLARTLEVEKKRRLVISLGSDDTLSVWLNGKRLHHQEVYRGAGPDQQRLTLELEPGESQLLIKIVNGGGPSAFYFKALESDLSEDVLAALRKPPAQRDPEQRRILWEHYKGQVWAPGRELRERLRAVEEEKVALEARIPTTMVLRDLPGGRQTYVLARGRYDAPIKERPVEPGVLEFLLPLPKDAPPNRLGLARWLVDPAHPLTPRVAVNRYWAMLFGRGLVPTVMDFGSQGEYPSHPLLLDWLARDFVAGGWNVKRTLREIVTSRTYRQASRRRSEPERRDPDNRLLWRGPRFRLQGEFIRDQALAVAGLLVRKVGGPGVKPYQPAGLWNEVSLDRGLRFQQDTGEKLYRKSMYIYWKRSAPMPAMTIFDAPTREKCIVSRQRTNTPLQSLVAMNDVQLIEAARHLAEAMMAAGKDFGTRLDEGFVRCTAHPADEARRQAMQILYERVLESFQGAPERAEALLAVGESPRDEQLDPIEHATWTVLASTLLNLDETLTRD